MKNDRLNARGNVRRYMAERMSENMPDRMQERYARKIWRKQFQNICHNTEEPWQTGMTWTYFCDGGDLWGKLICLLFFLHVFSSSSPICRGCIRKHLVSRSILWYENNKIWRCFFLSGFSVHVFGSELAGIGQRLSLQFLVASRW